MGGLYLRDTQVFAILASVYPRVCFTCLVSVALALALYHIYTTAGDSVSVKLPGAAHKSSEDRETESAPL